MTEDRDDKKLHPLGTFSHGGIKKDFLVGQKNKIFFREV